MTNKYYLWFTATVSVIYLVLSFLYASNQIITDEQWYLYLNALDAAKNGNYSIVGQVLPGVGPTVGSVGNFLTSLPLLFSDSPWAPMTFIIILRFMSFLLFSIGLRQFFGNKTLCCFAVMYLLSPWFLYETTLTQTSYVIFGVSVVFLSLVNLRSCRSPEKQDHFFLNPKLTKFLASMCLILGLGYCLQLSYLSISLVIMVLFILLRRAIKVSIGGIITGLGIIGLTVWAFLSSILTSDEIGSMFSDAHSFTDYSPLYLLENVARGILGWLRLGSTGYSHQIVRYFDPSIITSQPLSDLLSYAFVGFIYLVGAGTLLINIYATFTTLKETKGSIFSWRSLENDRTFLSIISVFAFLALLISALVLPLRFQVINVSTFLVFALLPMLMLIERYRTIPLHYFATFLVLLISFTVLVNLVSATSSKRFEQRSTMEIQLLERFENDEAPEGTIRSTPETDEAMEADTNDVNDQTIPPKN